MLYRKWFVLIFFFLLSFIYLTPSFKSVYAYCSQPQCSTSCKTTGYGVCQSGTCLCRRLYCGGQVTCPAGFYCYSPPYYCPSGVGCVAVMPSRYCVSLTPTPRPPTPTPRPPTPTPGPLTPTPRPPTPTPRPPTPTPVIYCNNPTRSCPVGYRCIGTSACPPGVACIASVIYRCVLVPTPPTCTLKSKGDANCNGVVEETDLAFIKSKITGLTSTCTNCSADFNNDGRVDLIDFEIWRNTFTASFSIGRPPITGTTNESCVTTPGGPICGGG